MPRYASLGEKYLDAPRVLTQPRWGATQISFDVPWAPRGVDGRYYPWKALADASDLLFVMSYDMRSQIYDACIAGANSPRALVQQGIDEYVLAFGVSPDKLVLGVPWYGYKYECEAGAAAAGHEESAAFGGGGAVCSIPAVCAPTRELHVTVPATN